MHRKNLTLHRQVRFCEGQIIADGVVTAEAEGIFVAVPPERMDALMAKRRAREEEMAK